MTTILLAGLLVAQGAAARDTVRPAIRAERITVAPAIDGRLSDTVWQRVSATTQFTQVSPRDGSPPSERTEVRVAYDDDALYIAARLFDSQPDRIVARLGRRDSQTDSDLFGVSIDSYHDHRTAFRFEVNAGAVKRDDITANDDGSGDASWDPVWDVATRLDELGWTAELRIPFSQLRFASTEQQTWGIQFYRRLLRSGESMQWSWAPNTESGHASLFGHLEGVSGLSGARSHRAEVMPYVVTQRDYESGIDKADPFRLGARNRYSGGADLKFGVSSGLTLTGTINPDFGQVEADPAEVNLTVFETYFSERRPFFVEGANLFQFGPSSFGAPTLFYSRRIGRPPSGGLPADTRFFDVPEVTSIRAAAKLSGRIGSWSVGLLDALTARERADILTGAGAERKVTVEPRSNYAIGALRRDFRGGASGVGFLATSVTRHIDTTSLRFLRDRAHSAGMDFFHRFWRNQYSINGTVAGSTIGGHPLAIQLAQRSSARYFQRPDQTYMVVDSTARSMSGYSASLSAGKVSGNWTFGTDLSATSPGFEVNDLGFQQGADRLFFGVRSAHRWLRPTKFFRSSNLYLNASGQRNYDGTTMSRGIYAGGTGVLHSQWVIYANGNLQGAALNDRVLRGGPMALVPPQWALSGGINSDSRRLFTVYTFGSLVRNESGGYGNDLSMQIGVRPTAALNIQFGPSFSERGSAAGYVTAATDTTAKTTFLRRYVVADLHQRTLDLTLRGNVTLSPTISFQLYTQPFTSAVSYRGYKAFDRPRDFEFIRYGSDGASTIAYDSRTRLFRVDADGSGAAPTIAFGNPDFRQRSLRANAVLRWEYRPGSTLYFAWAQGREGRDLDSSFDVRRDLDALLADDQRNRFLIKASYWLNP